MNCSDFFLLYYAKCHEMPFCMSDRLIADEEAGGGKKEGKDEEKGGDMEFII